MELYLQLGFGMMEHCRHLLSKWKGGTVILSPRDMDDSQLSNLASDITNISNGKILLDPQFYLPHSDHERLCSHSFWPSDYDTNVFWQGSALKKLLENLFKLNQKLGCKDIILPGLLATSVDDSWLETQRAFLEEATSLKQSLRLYSTIALSADVTRDQNQITTILEVAEKWNPTGYYIVCEHPNGSYLVDDPNWLANVLDLCAGLKLRGSNVILGYCNQQMLIAATAKVNAICSGTWMNVRSFFPSKFSLTTEEEIRQRAKWYYCPDALSEYKIPFLDIAHRQHLLNNIATPADLNGGYVDPLFSGAQPSSVDWTEQAAFRHYLHSLRCQVLSAERQTFDDTVIEHESLLNTAESLLNMLAAAGIRGQKRDFQDIIDVNRAALSVLISTRGPMLRRKWSVL